MKYNKLVRDLIPSIIKSRGTEPITHIANDEEFWLALKKKVLEEFDEFSKDESIEEYADLMEVLIAVAKFKGFSDEDIRNARELKNRERGAFDKRVILDEA